MPWSSGVSKAMNVLRLVRGLTDWPNAGTSAPIDRFHSYLNVNVSFIRHLSVNTSKHAHYT